MADITPDQLFPGLTATATDITIPLTALSGLTPAEADPATGDGREVARIITESMVTGFLGLTAQDRPLKMNVLKPNPQGIGLDQIRQAYTLSFDIAVDNSGSVLVPEV
jgi:hypothetical protein